MDRNERLKWTMEALWLVITAVIIFGIMFPIWRDVSEYPFNFTNMVHIFVFVTFARYIFLLKHTWLAQRKWVKIVLALSCIYIGLLLIRSLNAFTLFSEEYGLQSFMEDLPHKAQWPLTKYIRTEFIFFAVGSIITAILFPLRLIVSIWRGINRQGKV